MYLKIGRSSKVKIISINNMKEKLELRLSGNINRSIDELCDALVGLHAFTGCDSVSAFAGKGKSKSIKLLLSSEKYIDLFKGFGKEYLVTNDERKLVRYMDRKKLPSMMPVIVSTVAEMERLAQNSYLLVPLIRYITTRNVHAIKLKFGGPLLSVSTFYQCLKMAMAGS